MASLWQAWYGSDLLEEYFGFALPNVLFLEQDTNVVRFYRERDAQQKFLKAIECIVRDEPERLLAIYEKAHELKKAAEQYIARGANAFEDLENQLGFLRLWRT
ncbi:MAG: hypothetical protein O2904_05085 [bacterium]|nr:hypothetical protein [bacterium]